MFRARKQISQAFNPKDCLQRRRGELRLVCPQVNILKGDQLELSTLLEGKSSAAALNAQQPQQSQ